MILDIVWSVWVVLSIIACAFFLFLLLLFRHFLLNLCDFWLLIIEVHILHTHPHSKTFRFKMKDTYTLFHIPVSDAVLHCRPFYHIYYNVLFFFDFSSLAQFSFASHCECGTSSLIRLNSIFLLIIPYCLCAIWFSCHAVAHCIVILHRWFYLTCF